MENSKNTQQKLHIRSGDKVIVIAGNSKGKTGIVSKILREKSRVIVEGANMLKKHIKPTAQSPQGSIIDAEGSVHISNVKLIEPSTGKATRTGRKLNEKGKLQRFSKQTGNFI
jgi:large subunit ribosomal protein L24